MAFASRARAARLVALLCTAAAAGGCGDDSAPGDSGPPPEDAPPRETAPPPDGAPPPGATLEVGTGGTTYEPVEDGGPVELVHGPQGGYHILLAARFRGLDPDMLLLSYQVLRGDGTTPLNERFSVRLRRSTVTPSGEWSVRTGDLGVLAVTGPEDVVGTDAEVHAEAVAMDGTTATDVLRLRIVDEID